MNKKVFQLAGAFIACAIGSGFATGQEILQFFTSYGIPGLFGAAVTTLIFSWCGACFIKHGFEHGLTSPDQVTAFYFGKKGGKVASIILQVLLFAMLVIMIAGAGATLSDLFKFPTIVGRLLITVLAAVTVMFGLSKITDIVGNVGMVIILLTLAIGVFSYFRNPTGLLEGAAMVGQMDIKQAPGGWLGSAILYPGMNAILVLIFTCCLGADAGSKKNAIRGGMLGGILFGISLVIMDLAFLVNIEEVGSTNVPTIALAGMIGRAVAVIFSVVVFLGIYSTAAPLLWGNVRQLAEDRTKKSIILTLVLAAGALAFSIADFKVLVNVIYPLSGYVGIVLIIFVAVKEIRLLMSKKK